MSALTIRDPETEAGLRRLAAEHGRTLEAEAANLLRKAATEESAAPGIEPAAKGLGSEIVAIFAKHGGIDLSEPEPFPEVEPIGFSGSDGRP